NFDAQLNMIRTSKACELLTDTKESVMAVAMEVGYRNIKTFNTNFTKLVGMTPSEFRQRVTFQKGYDRE
ncbi:MAG: helix-turn-helix domain-containing protein, partial [Erysipelotrichales bacterium]|nr:helix-turn-helix domain-containing protein [Erysipelotrichales bacterium]